MPCTVTAFSVKIASLGDAGMELTIAREVIGDWNARHALDQKRILLPQDGMDARAISSSDMMIAFVCGKTGTFGGIEAEIELHLQGGRPGLVYFSEGRVDLAGGHASPGRPLEEFRKRHAAAIIDSYADEKELRAKLARQLDATISTHAHFKAGEPDLADVIPVLPDVAPAAEPLSPCAVTILSEACDDFEAYIGRIKAGGMLRIQANGKQLVEQNDAVTVAKWDSAFNELLNGDYIRDAGCNGQLFQISTKGFDFLKTIGKTPVGYIAELGGM